MNCCYSNSLPFHQGERWDSNPRIQLTILNQCFLLRVLLCVLELSTFLYHLLSHSCILSPTPPIGVEPITYGLTCYLEKLLSVSNTRHVFRFTLLYPVELRWQIFNFSHTNLTYETHYLPILQIVSTAFAKTKLQKSKC